MNHSLSQLLSAFQPYKAYSGNFKKYTNESKQCSNSEKQKSFLTFEHIIDMDLSQIQ